MKKYILLFGFVVITIISKSQSLWNDISNQGGLYNESDFYKHTNSQLPDLQAWLSDPTQQFYMEARYGYEDIYTGSLYIGWNIAKTIHPENPEKTDPFCDIDFTLMGGGVSGQVNGYTGAFSLDCKLFHKHLWIESENEYIYSIEDDQRPSFIYDWSKIMGLFGRLKKDKEVGIFGIGAGTQIQWGGNKQTNFDRRLYYLGPMFRCNLSSVIALEIFDYYDLISNNSSMYTFAIDIEKL